MLANVIRRSTLISLGLAKMGCDQLARFVQTAASRGEQTEEEWKKRWQKLSADSEAQGQQVLESVRNGVEDAVRRLGLVTRKDLDDLERRLRNQEGSAAQD